MIAKITKGRRAGGAMRYDFGPGHKEEHQDPRLITGSVPGTPQQVARLMDRHARQRPDVVRPIWRCSLSLPDEDGVLSDEQWAGIAEQYVGRMGFGDCPWVAVRHGDDHIHLTINRVQWSGEVASDRFDFKRSRGIVRELERENGLINAEERSDRVAPQVSGPERAAAERRGASRPEREELRERIRAARDATAGQGRLAFEEALRQAGVSYRANTSSTGRMSGYAFSLPGWTDGDGAQIWAPASRVARDLRWSELNTVLGQPDPRAAWSTPARPAAGPQQPDAPAPATQRSGMAAAARMTSTRRTGPSPRQAPGGAAAAAPARLPQVPQPGRRTGRGR